MNKVMVSFDIKGIKAQQYDRAMSDLSAQNALQDSGLICHTACVTSYGLKVIDVWESEEKFKKFTDTLMPILQKQGFPRTEPIIYPVHNFVLTHVYAS
jgi:hypothetical protein